MNARLATWLIVLMVMLVLCIGLVKQQLKSEPEEQNDCELLFDTGKWSVLRCLK